MDIVFNVSQAFYPGSSELDDACALRALLDSMIALNLAYLRYHSAPPLYESGVIYGRTTIWEPTAALYLPNKHSRNDRGRIWWDPIGESGGKKRGDCKSLACARIAELRAKGKRATPVFRFNPRRDGSGFKDFHILVLNPEMANGFEDPSRKLGMGADESKWFYDSM
jgi:hypothetical protein